MCLTALSACSLSALMSGITTLPDLPRVLCRPLLPGRRRARVAGQKTRGWHLTCDNCMENSGFIFREPASAEYSQHKAERVAEAVVKQVQTGSPHQI